MTLIQSYKRYLLLFMFCLTSAGLANKSSAETNLDKTEMAIFAGGCFWCMEKPFDKLKGVLDSTSGYIGGAKANPRYEEVSAGGTGHYEAVMITYDPKLVSYSKLLEVFWVNIDPSDHRGQFCDKGSQYLSAIFYLSAEQQQLAEQSKLKLNKNKQFQNTGIATVIKQAEAFYPAEDYHQNYYLRNPLRYNYYRYGCGRDQRLNEIWGSSKG